MTTIVQREQTLNAGDWTDIPGASGQNYTSDPADIGKRLRVRERVGSIDAFGDPFGPVTAPTPAGVNRGVGAVMWGNSFPYQTHLDKYEILSISGTSGGIYAEDTLYGMNLPVKRLGYCASNINWGYWAGVNYSDAVGTDMVLYTKDPNAGNALREVAWTSYDQLLTNVGNPAFQAAFLSQVRAYMQLHHLEGMYVDNITTHVFEVGPVIRNPNGTRGAACDFPYFNHLGQQVMSSDADWKTAMLSFLQNVINVLKNEGYYMMCNGGGVILDNDSSLARAWIPQWAQWTNGMLSEYEFEPYQSGYPLRIEGNADWYQHWDAFVQLQEYAESLGVDWFPFCHHPNPSDPIYLRYARYTRACFLMGWNGIRKSAWFWCPPYNGVDFWTPTHAIDTGVPTGARQKISNSWKRPFQHCTVYINPTLVNDSVDGLTIPAVDAVYV